MVPRRLGPQRAASTQRGVGDEAERITDPGLRRIYQAARAGDKGAGVKITEEEVRYVADLANLKLTDAEVRKFQADLDEILAHVDKLNEIDTSNVEPMAQVLYEAEETATLRADREVPPLGNAAALANAPLPAPAISKCPQVIER